MTTMHHYRKRLGLLLVALVIITIVALIVAGQVQAVDTLPAMPCSPSVFTGSSGKTICIGGSPVTWKGSTELYCGFAADLSITGKFLLDPTVITGGSWVTNGGSNAESITLFWEGAGFVSVLSVTPLSCEGSTHVSPPAPGIWAADLCVGDDGHDQYGWLTLDANTQGSPYAPTLYVAAGPDGPWYETGFMQPPYVMSYADTAALASWMGVANEGDLWFRATEAGTSANLASMFEDRAAHMDELCGN